MHNDNTAHNTLVSHAIITVLLPAFTPSIVIPTFFNFFTCIRARASPTPFAYPLSCCIHTALIPCLAAYILPSSPVLLHTYCPHPLSCCIHTALIPCLAAYILPSSPVLLHTYCPHPLSCCIYRSTAVPLVYPALPSLHPLII